jgi:signal transduction histidine kinase
MTRRVPSAAVDAGIGAGLFLVGTFELLRSTDPGLRGHRPVGLVLLLIAALGVAVRRKAPWAGFTSVLLASWISLLAHIQYAIGGAAFLCAVVVLYTVAERTDPLASVFALAMTMVTDVLVQRVVYQVSLPYEIQAGFPYLVLAWFAGEAQRQRRTATIDLEHRSVQLEEERERLAQAAVVNERSRIAQELHGLVVRGVEQIGTQTRAARLKLAAGGAHDSETLDGIETTGRSTLVEMRRLVSLLRTEDTMPTDGWVERESLPSDPRLSAGAAPFGLLSRWFGTPIVADGLVVLVMAGLAAAEPFSGTGFHYRSVDWALIIIATGALLIRRSRPLLTLVVVAGTIFAWDAVLRAPGAYAGDRAMLVAVFSVAAFRGPKWALVSIGAQLLAYGPLVFVPGTCDVACQVTWTPLFVVAAVAGIAVRDARRLNERLGEQTEILRRTRAEQVKLAVSRERTRVARDLHDMVAHGVTVMVVQAGAAGALAASDPVRADRALGAVERAGQQALQELESLEESLGWKLAREDEQVGEAEAKSIAQSGGGSGHDGGDCRALGRWRPRAD